MKHDHMKHDLKNPHPAVIIALILLLSIGLGFLSDFAITCFEKNAYKRDFGEYVSVYAHKYGVPETLIFAVIRTESSFDSGAVSRVGAVGLMQLMPETFEWLTDEILFEHLESGMLYDPETNIRYGTYYLSRMYKHFGNWETAFAAYNAGPTIVSKWLKDAAYSTDGKTLSHIPYSETAHYVKKVSGMVEKYKEYSQTEVQK